MEEETKKPFYRKIPGFRSGEGWKMGVAIFFYGLFLMVPIIVVINPWKVDTTNLPIKEQIKIFINNAIGEKTNHKEENLKSRVMGVVFQDNLLQVYLIATDNFSSNWIRIGILNDSKEIFSQIFDEFPKKVGKVSLAWYFPMIDARGNSKLEMVLSITFYRANATTINWDNFITDNFPKVASHYWQHPSF